MDKVELAKALADGSYARCGSHGVMGKACTNMNIAAAVIGVLSQNKGKSFRVKDIRDSLPKGIDGYVMSAQKISSILNNLVAGKVVKKTTIKRASVTLPNGDSFFVKVHISVFSI